MDAQEYEPIDDGPNGPVAAARAWLRELAAAGVASHRRVLENGDELVVFIPEQPMTATVETDFRFIVHSLNVRVRYMSEGWQVVGLEPVAV